MRRILFIAIWGVLAVLSCRQPKPTPEPPQKQAPGTTIYRSVGPGATSALATGAGNNLTISGSTATFDSALPDGIGVGCVIQYDDDNDGDIDANDSIAFIHGRTSSTEFTVKNAAGGTPTATAATDQDWSVFHAYISLANWESGTENTGIDADLRDFDAGNRDIDTNNEAWKVACYAGTESNTTETLLSGWTTSVDDDIYLYTPYAVSEVGISQRHSGIYTTDSYSIEADLSAAGAGAGVVKVNVDNVWIDGIQARLTGGDGSETGTIYLTRGVSASNIRVSNCLIRGTGATNSYGVVGFDNVGGQTVVLKIWNTIIYDFTGGGFSSAMLFNFDDAVNNIVYAYNVTVQNCTNGFYAYEVQITAKNCIFQDGPDGYTVNVGDFDGSTNNASDITSDAPGANPQTGEVLFVDEANDNFLIDPDDTVAKENGADLSADAQIAVTDDIIRISRPQLTNFDIGASEAQEPPAAGGKRGQRIIVN